MLILINIINFKEKDILSLIIKVQIKNSSERLPYETILSFEVTFFSYLSIKEL